MDKLEQLQENSAEIVGAAYALVKIMESDSEPDEEDAAMASLLLRLTRENKEFVDSLHTVD